MTKEQIDKFFNDHFRDIQRVVKENAPKCATANKTDITSDIYLICLEKADKIKTLDGFCFIRMLASNIYRWGESRFNEENRTHANETDFSSIYINDEDIQIDELVQERLFAIELYRLNAKPSELKFLDIYVNEGIRTVRGVQAG